MPRVLRVLLELDQLPSWSVELLRPRARRHERYPWLLARGVRRDPQAPRAPCGTLKPARPAALYAEPVQRHGRVVPSAGAPGMTGGPRQRCRFRPVGEYQYR